MKVTTGYGYWDLASGFGNGETMGVAAAYQIDAVRLYTTYAVATTDEVVVSNNRCCDSKISDVDSI